MYNELAGRSTDFFRVGSRDQGLVVGIRKKQAVAAANTVTRELIRFSQRFAISLTANAAF
jgi:hypothetical protein